MHVEVTGKVGANGSGGLGEGGSGAAGGAGGGASAANTNITDNVNTNTWKDNGGDVGSISSSPLRAVLLITQTPEAHRQIQSVLDSLRASQALQVSVETRFLIVQRNYLEDIGVNASFTFNPNSTWSSKFSPINVSQSQVTSNNVFFDANGNPLPPANDITLLCTPHQAQVLELAALTGRPWFVLRSMRDGEEAPMEGTTLAELRGDDDAREHDPNPAPEGHAAKRGHQIIIVVWIRLEGIGPLTDALTGTG